jgi:hypothetical protein
MRAAIFGGLVTALVFGGFVATAACGGDDNLLNPLDAGTDSATDSTVSSDAAPDAIVNPTDASNDASIIAPVTVTALAASGPVEGAVVVFYSPSGIAQPALLTNANGMVTTTAEKGSSVSVSIRTVPLVGAPFYDVTTFLQIEPGDQLTAVPENPKPPQAIDNGTVTIPFPGAVTNATNYNYADGCKGVINNAGGDTVLPVGPECLQNDGGTLQIFGSANASGGSLLASLETTGASYVDGGSVTGLAWSSITPTALAVTGTPSGAPTSLDFDVLYYVGDVVFGGFGSSYTLGGTFTAPQIGTPSSALLTTSVSEATLYYAETGTSYTEQITQSTFAAGLSADFVSMPPHVFGANLTTDGAGGASLSFSTSGPLTSLDGMTSTFDFNLALPDGGTSSGTWKIISPPVASLNAPPLTTDLVPAFPSSLTFDQSVLLHGTQFGSYGVYRRAYPKLDAVGELASAPYRIEKAVVAP